MKIRASATLRAFFGRRDVLEIDGDTVESALTALFDEYPEAKKVAFDDEGNLRDFIRVYANGEDKTARDQWSAPLSDDSEILLLPSISGGAPFESVVSNERAKAVALDDAEIERFTNHLTLREISVRGQKKIKAARVAVVGAGALGSAVIRSLAAAGVGTIKAIDFDSVEPRNLQTQTLHGLRDINRPKVASARDSVRNISKSIAFEAENSAVTADNAISLLKGFDLVLDCSDNYKARYLINDACFFCGIPVVFGAMFQCEGRVGVFNYNGGACYRCLFPSPPPPGLVPTCSENGVISPLPGIIGSIQANEAIKLIVGIGEPLVDKTLVFDVLNLRTTILEVAKDDKCPLCGRNRTIATVEDFDYDDFCGLKVDETEEPIDEMEPEELAKRIENGDPITIVDVREPHERAILRFPKTVVIPIGQLARRQKELDPKLDTVFVCKEGKRSAFAVRTLREAGYAGRTYTLKGGIDATRDIIFSREGGWL